MAHHITKRALYRRRMRGSIPYADILALEPTAFIQLRYARYAGKQVLFQDAACTIPVTSIGDPIGGVRSIVDGSIIATQTTDGDRPVWGGEGVGAQFDGISDELVVANADFGVDLDQDFSFAMSFFQALEDEQSAFFWGKQSPPASGSGVFFSDRSDASPDQAQFGLVDGINPSYRASRVANHRGQAYRAIGTKTADQSNLYFNGAHAAGISLSGAGSFTTTADFTIGSAGGERYWPGQLGELIFFQQELTAEERAAVDASLEAA